MPALYKFIGNPDALKSVLRGAAKFTPIRELNDPSELSPNLIIDEVRESLQRLRIEGYTEQDIVNLRRQECLLQHLAPGFQAVRVPPTPEQATALIRSSFYDSMPTLERLLSDVAREMSSKVGLFCLSLRHDSLPMWAHYAGNATGLVVEFRDLHHTFPGDETGVLRQAIPVRYERDRSSVTFDTQSHESIFFAKFRDWSYEQEVRIVMPLGECRQELVAGKLLYLYDLPSACIARVITGWNMPSEKVDTVRGYIRDINPRVQLVQTRFARGHVELS